MYYKGLLGEFGVPSGWSPTDQSYSLTYW